MPLNRPLRPLLTDAPRSPSDARRLVAFGADGDRTRADLFAAVSALGERLPRGSRWLVETEDAWRIAVALLGAARAGAIVALPPNLQPGTLDEIARDCDGALVDPSSPSFGLANAIDPDAPGRGEAAAGDGAAVDRDAPLVDLFTSGTSGPGKRVTKALRHLEDEVVELERGFGNLLPTDAAVIATVSAHHLYGLLFRVLWPLASSRALSRTSCLLPDDLLARVAAHPPAIVVSSPAHLRHLAASARLREHAGAIAEVFSSGGPLETRTALDLEAATGRAPLEIFGSTETGGVASRRASTAEPSPPWRVFAPVAVARSSDGRLVVTSPFVTAPSAGETARDGEHTERGEPAARGAAPAAADDDATPGATADPPVDPPRGATPSWRMGDRVELDGDGFRLLGRGDRVAKIGENTLSLPEIEQHLVAHDLVEAAAVGPFAGPGGPRLGALLVLAAAGKRHLAAEGRRATQALLSAHLAERWTRVALPRRWRFVDDLPADARGKVAQQALEAALASPVDEPREPLVLARRTDGDDVLLELVVPRELAYLAGHYDAFPLVPGVVQIHWVLAALARLLGRDVSAERMEAVKFRNVLRPAQEFTMRLSVDASASRATFTLAHEGRVFSSGRLTLAA